MCDKEENFIACDTLVKIIADYDDVYKKKSYTHKKDKYLINYKDENNNNNKKFVALLTKNK